MVSELGLSGVARGGANHPRRPNSSRGRFALFATVPAVVVLTAVSACTSSVNGNAPQSPVAHDQSAASHSAAPPSTTPVPKPVIATTPAGTSVSPIQPVTVSVTAGKLTSVKLVNPQGKVVSGALAADSTSWRNTEDLGYGKTYTLSVVAVDAAGRPTTKKSAFTTVTPGDVTTPYLQRAGGYGLDNAASYGVGIIPVVHFGQAIPDHKAAEKALIVTTTPHVDGAWNWMDSSTAHWRPKAYFAPGTKVTVTAKVYGVKLGPRLYGETSKSVSFTISAKHVAIADDNTHQVKVYFNDKLVRTMPTSMGRGGYVQGTDRMIPLWTYPGTYTVLTHENPAIMSSASYGLPADSPAGYAPEKIYWATKISVSGIYLHELDATVGVQGHRNVSHGCLNLNKANAQWYFQHAVIGDVVTVLHTGGPKLQVWQNGDWIVPWATWVKGSALN